MKHDSVLLECNGRIAEVTLNKPETGNCLDENLVVGLQYCLGSAAENEAVDAVILKGAGRFFCTGGDLAPLAVLKDSKERFEVIKNTNNVIRLMTSIGKPIIALVHGTVAGAGVGLALASDFIISARGTRFITAFSKVGLVSDCGVVYFLTRLLGKQKAMELLMLSEPVVAEEFYRLGLINFIVNQDELYDEAVKLAEKILEVDSLTRSFVKEGINRSMDSSLEQMLVWEESVQATCLGSDGFKRKVQTFLNRRSE